MKAEVAAWQLDIFGEASPVLVVPPKPDPLPHPSLWSASVRAAMIDALISLARDSRRGDRMPESLMDCATLLSERLRNVRIDVGDYEATLGWIMGFWDGALSYRDVCRVNGIDPETLQDVILERPLLAHDLKQLRLKYFGKPMEEAT
jgi:hypothetical protein